ncbi:MAG: glycosyltransferase family 39 protein [Drouetiella hepatica Uher 2000/2452]|uniref:Glycosyltransferase family 39 protein n=1 Tax=Drouetiella hepatica Uher 2000/2452 TaxID=904376 RepID=A0A951Q7M0_9CYAN|nr:glycosyltransferase family 39 protein [Drouetiella hepatica Uher 2000/2452]
MGIFFRFVNLDRQVFWDDEAFTALRMSGYTAAELQQILYTSEDLSFPEIQKYLAPNLDKGIGDVIQGLALEDPHIPPFYILILRAWVQFLGEAGKELCGSSLGVMRSFSAIAGVLSLPAMYWLGLELFRSRLAASLGVALMAVSPFFVVYSQEARAYSFWGLITLASSALLLRTLRQPTKLRWLLYALSVSFGIYTHLFSILVTVGHGIYIFMVERYRFSKNFVSYLLATALGVATFTPWLVILISNARKTEEMVYNSDVKLEKAPFLSMISMWIGNISRIFFDVGVGSSDRLNDIILLVPIILPCFLLAICSIYFLCKNSSFRTWLFVIALIAVPAVFYVAVDVTQGIKVSGIPRYSVAIFIGIQLAVAFTFSTILTQKIYESDRLLSLSNSKNFIEQETHDKKNYRTTGVVGNYRFWKTLLVIVLSLGVISCMTRIPAKVWWNKGPENTRYVVEISSLIHRSHHPVVMTDDALNRVAAFGYELNPGVPIRLVRKGNLPKLPPDPREIFVFRPSEFLRRNIEQIGQGVLRPLPDTGDMLYKLDRTNSASRT